MTGPTTDTEVAGGATHLVVEAWTDEDGDPYPELPDDWDAAGADPPSPPEPAASVFVGSHLPLVAREFDLAVLTDVVERDEAAPAEAVDGPAYVARADRYGGVELEAATTDGDRNADDVAAVADEVVVLGDVASPHVDRTHSTTDGDLTPVEGGFEREVGGLTVTVPAGGTPSYRDRSHLPAALVESDDRRAAFVREDSRVGAERVRHPQSRMLDHVLERHGWEPDSFDAYGPAAELVDELDRSTGLVDELDGSETDADDRDRGPNGGHFR